MKKTPSPPSKPTTSIASSLEPNRQTSISSYFDLKQGCTPPTPPHSSNLHHQTPPTARIQRKRPSSSPANDDIKTPPTGPTPPSSSSNFKSMRSNHEKVSETMAAEQTVSNDPPSTAASVVIEDDNSPSRIEIKSSNVKKKKTMQMYLDLGQRNFAKQTICKHCGMLFVHGLDEDAKQHTAICIDVKQGVVFSLKNPRVVHSQKHDRTKIVEVSILHPFRFVSLGPHITTLC